jgi:tetratricopeptide (TPR) repeat protein
MIHFRRILGVNIFLMLCGLDCIAQGANPLANTRTLRTIDSLEQKLQRGEVEDPFMYQLGLYGRLYQLDTVKAAFYLKQCIKLANQSGDSLQLTQAALAQGHFLNTFGNTDGAVEAFERGLRIAKRNKYRPQIRYLLNNIAIAYADGGRYDKALHYNFESLRERQLDGDSSEISVALSNIGYSYSELGDHESALKYHMRGYNMKVRNNIRWGLAIALSNIGEELVDLARYREAEEKIQLAVQECLQHECDNKTLVDVYYSLGVVLAKQAKPAKAPFEKSLQLGAASGLLKEIIGCRYWLAQLEYENNNLSNALDHLEQAKKIGDVGGPKINALILRLYALIYARIKDYEKAFSYQNQHLSVNQEIINGNLVQRVASVHAEFEERENLAKLATQTKIMEYQSALIGRQKILNILTCVIVLLAVGLIIVLIRNIWNKKRINLLLDLRIRERTSELETNRDQLLHAHDQQRIIISKLSSELVSTVATLKGLAIAAEKELPEEKVMYFRRAEMVAEKLVKYVNQHSIPTTHQSDV